MTNPIPYSVLDLAWVPDNLTPAEALRQTPKLAAHVEQCGYHRYWVAEHHNMQTAACSATAVVLGYAGTATQRIRLGSGGIMLPNHAPLIVAEQFGTLAAFYPDRIDLGIGRAPGTDGATVRALRRDPYSAAETFVEDVAELQHYFASDGAKQAIVATPAAAQNVPLWILGSSTYGAQVAAMMGLPYAFASHFAPHSLAEALDIYRRNFQPSAQLNKPYVMLAMTMFCAESDTLAQEQASTLTQMSYHLLRGKPQRLQPPDSTFMGKLTPEEQAHIKAFRKYAAVGTPTAVCEQIDAFAREFNADEIILAAPYYNFEQRLKAYSLVSEHASNMKKSH